MLAICGGILRLPQAMALLLKNIHKLRTAIFISFSNFEYSRFGGVSMHAYMQFLVLNSAVYRSRMLCCELAKKTAFEAPG